MKTSEHLFYLIKSLSKSEKRSFKIFAKQYSKRGENHYTLLFDAIDKMQIYDHKALIKAMSERSNAKMISTLKVQLNDLIMKSLRQNSSSYNYTLKLRQDIDYIEILFQKGLYPQAKKLLEKTVEFARMKEDYLALDQLSILEYNIALKQSNKEDLDHYVNITYPEVREARKTNDTLADFEFLSVKMRICLLEGATMERSETLQRLEDIISHPLMNVDITTYPKRCQLDFHAIWGHYHFVFDHPEEMYFHRKRVLEIMKDVDFEKRKWLTHARFLLVGLSTYKMFAAFDRELEEINKTIRSIPAQSRTQSFSDELDHTLNNIKLNRDMDAGDYSNTQHYISELETKYGDSSLQIDDNLRMVFFFNFIYAHLANKNYKKALFWSNEILNSPQMRDIRADAHGYVRMKLICINYGLEHYDMIRHLVKSAQRYLKKRDLENSVTSAFLRFANNHLTEPYSARKEECFDQIISEIEVLSLEESGKISLEYFNSLSWLRSIRNGTSMEIEEKKFFGKETRNDTLENEE